MPRILSREIVCKGKLLEFENIRIDADTINYEVFTRPRSQTGVNVLALTKDREFIFVEEYRPALDQWVVSLVCGVAEKDQSPEENARRELLEETGYASETMINLCQESGPLPACPGVFTEFVYSVAMLDCERVAAGGGVAAEQEVIKTHVVPAERLRKFLREQRELGKAIFGIHAALGLLYLHKPELLKELGLNFILQV